MDLIPGLPNDVALECLLRIPLLSLAFSRRVSRGWKVEIESPDFMHRRKAIGSSQIIVVGLHISEIVQKTYHLASYEPDTGEWSDLPAIPNYPDLLLNDNHLLAVGSKLVVLNGGEKSSHVLIYDFLTMTWRRGAPIPETESFFACASDYDQTVYVAGGINCKTKVSTKAFAYNVEEDKWTRLPDMPTRRVLCTGIYQDGKFHVVGGLSTYFSECRSKEVFDVTKWQWGRMEEDFLEKDWCLLKCVTNQHNGKIYMCEDGNVSVREGAKWRVLVSLPDGMNKVGFMQTWHDKLFVIGCKPGEPYRVYVMDTESCIWTEIDTPKSYLGNVQLGSYLEF